MHMLSNPTVAVRNLSKTYKITKGGGYPLPWQKNLEEVTALKPTSFVAYAGESIGVLGKNGSGKSTLMSLISGSEAPSTGEIFVSAQPSLLSVSAALQPHLSGLENAKLGLLAKGLSPDNAAELAESAARWAEIGDAINRPISTYSSGMAARLKFSIATVVRPEILLVDEALATGDATFNNQAQKRMNEFLQGASTVFIVSHSSATIQRNCTRAIWLHEGELIADMPARQTVKWYNMWSEKAASGDRFGAAKLIRRMQNDFSSKTILFDSEAIRMLDGLAGSRRKKLGIF